MKQFAMVALALVLTASMMTACRRGTSDMTEGTTPSATMPSQATQPSMNPTTPTTEPMPSVDVTTPQTTTPTSESEPSETATPKAHPEAGPRPDRAMRPDPDRPETR